ncbi:acyl homoserine lactone synthase [uncultured bacterium]|nr:acyl homoserine lactone synthase [uncultured bacterium]
MAPIHFKKVSSAVELEEVYRLRYKVYCEERGFEKPEDHPDGLEIDAFDRHSVHFGAFNEMGELIGTARIILNSGDGFPLEKNCVLSSDVSLIERERLGEISRLALKKEYRRRAEDNFIYNDQGDAPPEFHSVPNDRRNRHEIVIGLYKLIYIESRKRGLTHWYTVMAKGLYLLLKRMGIFFQPIGPTIEYHGQRTPYLGGIEDIEAAVASVNPALFHEATEELGRTQVKE